MKIIPQSNQSYIRKDSKVLEDDGTTITKFEVAVSNEMEKTAVNIAINPGDFSIHNGFVIHSSEPNLSNRMRKIYTMRYADTFTTKFSAENWHIPFFLVRGESPGESFYIDLRPDKALPSERPNCSLVNDIISGKNKKIPKYY